MQLGFNENILYKGELYHIQTEDGGQNNPVVTTTIFKGGGIVTSKKTSYEDILKSEKLDVAVKDIIREQHSAVVKDLKKGVFGKASQAPLFSEGEKGIDDIILEYLSVCDKKQ